VVYVTRTFCLRMLHEKQKCKKQHISLQRILLLVQSQLTSHHEHTIALRSDRRFITSPAAHCYPNFLRISMCWSESHLPVHLHFDNGANWRYTRPRSLQPNEAHYQCHPSSLWFKSSRETIDVRSFGDFCVSDLRLSLSQMALQPPTVDTQNGEDKPAC
jgi:hypothetical protein